MNTELENYSKGAQTASAEKEELESALATATKLHLDAQSQVLEQGQKLAAMSATVQV